MHTCTHTCMHTRRKHTFKFLLTCKSALAFHAKHSHLIYSSVELSLIPVYGSDSSRGVMVWLQPLLKNTHRHTLLDVVTNELRCSKVLITLVEALCRSHPTHNVSPNAHAHTLPQLVWITRSCISYNLHQFQCVRAAFRRLEVVYFHNEVLFQLCI